MVFLTCVVPTFSRRAFQKHLTTCERWEDNLGKSVGEARVSPRLVLQALTPCRACWTRWYRLFPAFSVGQSQSFPTLPPLMSVVQGSGPSYVLKQHFRGQMGKTRGSLRMTKMVPWGTRRELQLNLQGPETAINPSAVVPWKPLGHGSVQGQHDQRASQGSLGHPVGCSGASGHLRYQLRVEAVPGARHSHRNKGQTGKLCGSFSSLLLGHLRN